MRLHLFEEYVPIFPTEVLGFRIRRLNKLYCLNGIHFHVSLVTLLLFDLCNDTRTALDTPAHSWSCTPSRTQFELHTHSSVSVTNINKIEHISCEIILTRQSSSIFYAMGLGSKMVGC